MWTPPKGNTVRWFWQDGTPAGETTFDPAGGPINTPRGLASRYAAGPGEQRPQRDGVYAILRGQAEDGGAVGAALLRAAQGPNEWGLKPADFTGDVSLLILDFGATQIGAEGVAESKLLQEFPPPGDVGDWPAKPGDSTDPARPTHGRWNRAHGLFSARAGGKDYFYWNDLHAPGEERKPVPATPGVAAAKEQILAAVERLGELVRTSLPVVLVAALLGLAGTGLAGCGASGGGKLPVNAAGLIAAKGAGTLAADRYTSRHPERAQEALDKAVQLEGLLATGVSLDVAEEAARRLTTSEEDWLYVSPVFEVLRLYVGDASVVLAPESEALALVRAALRGWKGMAALRAERQRRP